jgi:hypothetical protein
MIFSTDGKLQLSEGCFFFNLLPFFILVRQYPKLAQAGSLCAFCQLHTLY